jgi:phosphatidylserine/phosphatidylglycerophosphate/cardiolipin synthase-like enzyme
MRASASGVDAMVRVEGPAAWALEAVSLSLTALQTGADFAPPPPPDLPPAGSSLVQIFPSGPQSSSRHIEQLLLAAIYSARREVVLTTPYFIPSEALLTALRSAAMRGVRVVLIVPARVDSMLVRYAGNAYFNDLLAAGVEVLCFGDGLLHTKSMVIDGEVTIFGTVNLDLRSFELNFEVSLIAYDVDFFCGHPRAAGALCGPVHTDRSGPMAGAPLVAAHAGERGADDEPAALTGHHRVNGRDDPAAACSRVTGSQVLRSRR